MVKIIIEFPEYLFRHMEIFARERGYAPQHAEDYITLWAKQFAQKIVDWEGVIPDWYDDSDEAWARWIWENGELWEEELRKEKNG